MTEIDRLSLLCLVELRILSEIVFQDSMGGNMEEADRVLLRLLEKLDSPSIKRKRDDDFAE